MTLPDAAYFTGSFAGRSADGTASHPTGRAVAGFSVPGLEIYRHHCDGSPCEPCEIDEGDTCRPRWVNRQDHGALTRVNIARANHENMPYCCPTRGMTCGSPDLRTEVFGPGTPWEGVGWEGAETLGFDPADLPPLPIAGAQGQTLDERRALVERIRSGARARQGAIAGAIDGAIAGAVEEVRSRRTWGNHNRYNEHAVAGRRENDPPVGVRYIPMAGQPGPLTEDVLIVAPGHHTRR